MIESATGYTKTIEAENILPNDIVLSKLYTLTPTQREYCQLIISGVLTTKELAAARVVSQNTVKQGVSGSEPKAASLRNLAIRLTGRNYQKNWGMFRILTTLFRAGVLIQTSVENKSSYLEKTRDLWANCHISEKKGISFLPFDLRVSTRSTLTPALNENLRLMLLGHKTDIEMSNIRGVSVNTIGKQINGSKDIDISIHNKVARIVEMDENEEIKRNQMLLNLIRSGDIEQIRVLSLDRHLEKVPYSRDNDI